MEKPAVFRTGLPIIQKTDSPSTGPNSMLHYPIYQ